MLCGRCCVTEPPTKLALRLDIFIEILPRTRLNRLYRLRNYIRLCTAIRHSAQQLCEARAAGRPGRRSPDQPPMPL